MIDKEKIELIRGYGNFLKEIVDDIEFNDEMIEVISEMRDVLSGYSGDNPFQDILDHLNATTSSVSVVFDANDFCDAIERGSVKHNNAIVRVKWQRLESESDTHADA